ncbi:MAG: hypothetical protein ABJF05_01665 [Paracoccaceae bacterium]
MQRMKTVIAAGLAALSIAAVPAYADISAGEIDTIKTSRSAKILSSDGALLGNLNGIRLMGNGRVRVFISARNRSIHSLRGREVILTTRQDLLTVKGGNIVVDASRNFIRQRTQKSGSDSSAPADIVLLSN